MNKKYFFDAPKHPYIIINTAITSKEQNFDPRLHEIALQFKIKEYEPDTNEIGFFVASQEGKFVNILDILYALSEALDRHSVYNE